MTTPAGGDDGVATSSTARNELSRPGSIVRILPLFWWRIHHLSAWSTTQHHGVIFFVPSGSGIRDCHCGRSCATRWWQIQYDSRSTEAKINPDILWCFEESPLEWSIYRVSAELCQHARGTNEYNGNIWNTFLLTVPIKCFMFFLRLQGGVIPIKITIPLLTSVEGILQ